MFPFLFLAHTHTYLSTSMESSERQIITFYICIELAFYSRMVIMFMTAFFRQVPVPRQESERSCICVPRYIFCFYPRFFNWMLELFQQFCFIFYCYLLGMPDQRGISLTYLLTNYYHFVKSYLNIS